MDLYSAFERKIIEYARGRNYVTDISIGHNPDDSLRPTYYLILDLNGQEEIYRKTNGSLDKFAFALLKDFPECNNFTVAEWHSNDLEKYKFLGQIIWKNSSRNKKRKQTKKV